MTNHQVSAVPTKAWPLVATVAAGWALVAFASLSVALARGIPRLQPVPENQVLGAELLSLGMWVLLSLPAVLLIRSLVGRPPAPVQKLLASGLLGLLFALLFWVVEERLLRFVMPSQYLALENDVLPSLDERILAFLMIVTLAQRDAGAARPPDKAARPIQSRGDSEQHKIPPLLGQLEAHFLFNTLNDAAQLVHVDPQAADDVITRVSNLLRAVLAHAEEERVALSEEIGFIRAYTEIHAVRLKDRLTVDWEFASDIEQAAVPIFVCQPILENAFRHGADPATGRVELQIGARHEESDLVFWVRDHGRGLNQPFEYGVGLANTRARLARLYGTNGSLDLCNLDRGVLAVIRLPFSTYHRGLLVPAS